MLKSKLFPVDILDDGNAYHVIIDIPGVSIENLSITGGENYIIISGIKEKYAGKNYILMERYSGKFSRKIFFPENINIQAAEAEYDKGVLYVKIPKIKNELFIDTSIKVNIIYRR